MRPTTDTSSCGVLFDLDGVLLDTEGIYTRFWEDIDRRFPTGVPHFAQVIKGRNLHDILTENFADPVVRRRIVELLDEHQRDMRYELFDGAMDFVEQLNRAGIATAIVTSSDARKMEAVYKALPHFKQHFNQVVVGEMVTHAKPHPACFELGARLIERDPRRCYIFEDSVNGLRAARAAGGHVIGVATTNSRETVAPLADLVVDTLKGITVEQMLAV